MSHIFNIDYFSRRLFCKVEDDIGVYDLDTVELLEKPSISLGYAYDCKIYGNVILSEQGFKYELTE